MFYIIAIVVVALDQLSKYWVTANMADQPYLDFGNRLFSFRYIRNSGAAFSILRGKQSLLIVFTAVLMLCILVYFFYYKKTMSKIEMCSLALILGGGIGNMIDRILYSSVVDFIELEFINFPIFNVADIAITCGCILFAVSILFSKKL